MTTSPIEAVSSRSTNKSRNTNLESSKITTYRLMILYRFILALFGGYILSTLSAIIIADTFSEDRASAAMAATLIAFVLWMSSFIWVFIVNKTLKASLGIILPSMVLFVIYKLLGN